MLPSAFKTQKDAVSASNSGAELAAFVAKEELDKEAKKKKKKKEASLDDEEPKLFMELGWSAQRRLGTKEPVLRQVEGDSVKQRLRAYRRSIFFHIHGRRANKRSNPRSDHLLRRHLIFCLDLHGIAAAKLDHNGYLLQQLRMNKLDPNGKDVSPLSSVNQGMLWYLQLFFTACVFCIHRRKDERRCTMLVDM